MTTRPHDARRVRVLMVALAIVLPAATAASFAQDAPIATTPSTTPTRTVAEEVGTAREIKPFGAARQGEGIVTWAIGQTRAPSAVPASSPESPWVRRPPETTPQTTPAIVDDDETVVAIREGRAPAAPPPTTPGDTLLLEGTAKTPVAPTAWRRADPPLDVAGEALKLGEWRPAGRAGQIHAGESTPGGAAALLVTTGAPSEAAPQVLARRRDGRFQLLPSPPTELLAPATRLYDPAADDAIPSLAAVDPEPAPGDDTPPPTGSDTTPTGPTSPTRTRGTALLLMPPGGDGVLAWDGTAWAEEPFEDATGAAITLASTPVAMAATPQGEGVALVASSDAAAVDRVTLYHRTATRRTWREVPLQAPLLRGPLPGGIVGVTPTLRPGDPLTVAPGHWWVDVIVERSDGGRVAATVHLAPPGSAPAPTTPGTAPDPVGTGAPTSPDPTGPSPTSSTPADTTPVPQPVGAARSTGVWCVARGSGKATNALPGDLCSGELPGSFPTSRGYRSQGFAAPGTVPGGVAPSTPATTSAYGARVLTSPVLTTDAETPAERDRSGSGGYLRLDGERFTIRSGLGENATASGGTDAAAFTSDRLGWIGGQRLVGHVMPSRASSAGQLISTSPSYDTAVDIAPSPLAVPEAEAGALVLATGQVRRVFNSGQSSIWGNDELYRLFEQEETRLTRPRALAWPLPDLVAVAGTGGLLLGTQPPPAKLPPFANSRDVQSSGPGDIESVPEARGMDLLDVEFATIGPDEPAERLAGWAVGRDGAALRLDLEEVTPVKLASPLADADLRSVGYAGKTAYVASSEGLLVEANGTLVPESGLAALLTQDGRPKDVRTVAGLPDGAVVVDARYVRNAPGEPWRRLPSPAEGDVVAVSLSRPSGDPSQGISSLMVYASIADEARPRVGERITRWGPSSGEVPELPNLAVDGRLVQLTPDGWVDRERNAVDLGVGRDLPAPEAPIQAIITRADGTGWAIGATTSWTQFDEQLTYPRNQILRITPDATAIQVASGSAPPTAVPARVGRRAVEGSDAGPVPKPASESSGTRAQNGADPGRIRILIGGHPACLDECAGRDDQRVGPTENLRQAFQTAERMAAPSQPNPVRAVVIGGGRGSTVGAPLSRPGAINYGDLLGSADGPPVFAGVGAGDVTDDAARFAFA
ncbi:MAG: hypothetical protein JHD16_02585, partial [Solirubrobacteraceae bacterium]|nr:hypothetical protein [Solirubrobacteraceae bacterium]